MRRLAPILTFAIIVAGLYWVFGVASRERRGPPSSGSPSLTRPDDAASRSAAPASRPQSFPTLTPLPSAESEPESRAESGPATVPVVVIEVVREDGRPIPYASLKATVGDTAFNAVTDLEGRAETEAHPGITAWLNLTGSFQPTDREVSFDSGVRRIIVPTRAMVAGHLLVSGERPGEQLRLWLGVSPDVYIDTWCDEDGRFEFFNLPPAWHGDLEVPDDYFLAGSGTPSNDENERSEAEPRTLHLQGPSEGLVVKLVPLPAIKGRLVRPVTKDPVVGYVRHEVGPLGNGGGQSYTRGRKDGRFRLRVDAAEVAASLTLSDDRGLGARSLTVSGPFSGVRDLGDVEIGPTRLVGFHVHDGAGAPIAGAVAEIAGTWSTSDPTDANGAATIRANAEGGELRVAKLGYKTASLALPNEIKGVLDVTLEGGNKLVIEVLLPDGSPPNQDFVRIVLSSTDAMFAGDAKYPDGLLQRAGVSDWTSMGAEESATGAAVPQPDISCSPDGSGRIMLGGFRPGAQVAIKLFGTTLGDLLDESFVVMEAAGTKTVKLRIQTMPRPFAGIVRSVDGNPIPNAEFWLVDHGGSAFYGSASETGRFSMGGIFGDSIPKLMIAAQGFVSATYKHVPVPAAGSEREFTLIRAREITIELVDENGRLLRENSEVAVRVPGLGDDEQPRVDEPQLGTFVVGGLPPGIVEINATVGVAHAGIRHDSRNPLARIVIPSVGGAEIHWTRARTDPARCRVHVQSVPAGTEAFVDVPDEVTDHYLEAILHPGTYQARVEGFEEATDHWVDLGSSRQFTVKLREGVPVEVTR